ncbi:hypothetical protein JCM10295v2_006436 [Rhodotorula toruloides]
MNRLQAPCTCLRATLTPRTALARPAAASIANPWISRRALHAKASVPREVRVPQPRDKYQDPASLLAVSKRGLEEFAEKVGSWDNLFMKSGKELREAGMNIKQSKYCLWLLEKYRQGFNPAHVAIPQKPKKKFRGWGPKIQHGVRVKR